MIVQVAFNIYISAYRKNRLFIKTKLNKMLLNAQQNFDQNLFRQHPTLFKNLRAQ